MFISNEWKDYQLIDANRGMRLERWGNFTVSRPDPAAFWDLPQNETLWQSTNSIYHRNTSGGGTWEHKKNLPEKWQISYKNMHFWVKPMGFKHMGIFPEQATNWDFIQKHTKKGMKILNLFAYTGGATLAAALSGAEVVHVDSSKGIVQMAKENAELNKLSTHPIRYIVDDCAKFVAREIRRGNKYDGIIMDPPSYGRGTNGEIWKIEDNLAPFLTLCKKILVESPAYVIINSYTTGLSAGTISALSEMILGHSFPHNQSTFSELGIPIIERKKTMLPSGATVRNFNI